MRLRVGAIVRHIGSLLNIYRTPLYMVMTTCAPFGCLLRHAVAYGDGTYSIIVTPLSACHPKEFRALLPSYLSAISYSLFIFDGFHMQIKIRMDNVYFVDFKAEPSNKRYTYFLIKGL